jgi:hypothetical protein
MHQIQKRTLSAPSKKIPVRGASKQFSCPRPARRSRQHLTWKAGLSVLLLDANARTPRGTATNTCMARTPCAWAVRGATRHRPHRLTNRTSQLPAREPVVTLLDLRHSSIPFLFSSCP